MNQYGWVFAAVAIVSIVLNIFLYSWRISIEPAVVITFNNLLASYGSIIGGTIAALGTIFAGFLAFKATSKSTLEQTRQIILSENNKRASELRELIGFYTSIIDILIIKLDIYREFKGKHAQITRDSITFTIKSLEKGPKINLIYPEYVDEVVSMIPNKINGALSMMEQIFPLDKTMIQTQEEIVQYLAYDIEHAAFRLAEAKSLIFIINQFYYALKNSNLEIEQFNFPKRSHFDEIADEFSIDKDDLFAQIAKGGVPKTSPYYLNIE